jgi:rRNA maturation endonuclease Nob1
MNISEKSKILIRFSILETLIIISVPSLFLLIGGMMVDIISFSFYFSLAIVISILSIFNTIFLYTSKEKGPSRIKESLKKREKPKKFRGIILAKLCPNCKNLSNINADYCRYCGTEIKKSGIICPECSQYLNIDAERCKYCGFELTEKGIICPHCHDYFNLKNGEEFAFCEHCGRKIENLSEEVEIKVSRISEYIDKD